MNIDEWRDRVRATSRETSRTPSLAIIHEAVRMQALTGNEHFDWFSRYLEASIKAERRNRERLVEKMCQPLLPDEALRECKIGILLSDSRIEAFTEILLLPKRLLESGTKARAEIEGMERDASARLTA